MTLRLRNGRTSLLALFLGLALGGLGAAQTAPASMSITGLPEWAEAGSPVTFTVTVLDETGAPMTGYTGTVHCSSSVDATSVADDYTYGPEDAGSHEFSFTPQRAGRQTIRVADVKAGRHASQATWVAPVSVPGPEVSKATPGVSTARPVARAGTRSRQRFRSWGHPATPEVPLRLRPSGWWPRP